MAILPHTKSKYLIYAIRLTHDLSHEYRYVGKSSSGVKRMKSHLRAASNPNNPEYSSGKYRWIRKHFSAVTFDVLEEFEDDTLLSLSEMKWIHVSRTRGHRLLNATDGGDGASGRKHTQEHKAYMSNKLTGHPVSEITRRRIGDALRGIVWDDDRKHTQSVRLSGLKRSEYSKITYSKSKIGEKNPQYGRKGDLSPTFGMKHSEEAKMAQRQAAFRQHHSYGNHDSKPREGCLECLSTISAN